MSGSRSHHRHRRGHSPGSSISSDSGEGKSRRRRHSTPWCDALAQRLLVGLLAFMPLAFGAVEAWSELVVWVVCLGLAFCLAARAWKWKTTGGLRWTPALVPLSLFVLLGLLQALPVPFSLIEWLSPHAAGLYQTLRQDILGSFTLSLYARSTWHDLCIVIAASVIFLTVINVFRRSDQIRRLLLSVAIIGAGLAVLALLQSLFGNGHIYWIGPKESQPNSGTFACHNHFSQHMNLSVMAMLGYAMMSMRQTLGRQWLERDSIASWFRDPDHRLARWLLVMAVVGLISIAMSLSRMGIVSSVAAIIALTLMLTLGKGLQRSLIPMLVGLAAVSAVILIGFEAMYERMATLKSLDIYQNRWTVVTDLVPAFGHFLAIGSGLGTFSAVYPLYDTGTITQFASHAENEYAQLMLEMGVVGTAAVLWFVGFLALCTIRATRRARDPVVIVAPALAAGLLAVAIHSWTDFGQHLPAIAGLSAVFCGLLVVLGQRAGAGTGPRTKAQQSASPAPVAVTTRTTVRPAGPRLAAGLVGLLGMLLILNIPAAWWRVFAEELDAAARDSSAQLEKSAWKTPDAQAYARLIEQGEAAVSFDPGNALYRYRLAVYRWRCVVRGRTKSDVGDAPPPEFLDVAEQIVTEMIVASSMCPTMGALHCWRGQMEWWVLGREEGRDRVENGIRTARSDPIAWCAAGQLAAAEGNLDLALERYRRAVELRGGMLSQAAQVLAKEGRRPDLLLALAGDDPQRLSSVADTLRQYGFTAEAAQAQGQCILIYRARVNEGSTPAWAIAMLAAASSQEGRHEESAALYRQALAKEYTRLPWRLACVRELLQAGQIDEALRELQIAQRLQPDSKDVQALGDVVSKARRQAATQAAAATKAAAATTEPSAATQAATQAP